MVTLRLVPTVALAVACLVPGAHCRVRGGRAGADAGEQAKPQSSELKCLDEMNQARELSAFTAFKDASDEKHKVPATDDFLKRICGALYPSDTPDLTERRLSGTTTDESLITALNDEKNGVSGAWAYLAPQTGVTPTCETARDEWFARAHTQTAAPAAPDADADFYKKLKNLSFIALYNPGEAPTLSCRKFKCLVATQEQELPAAETKYHPEGILCLTSPELPKDAAPFTAEQWDRIQNGVKPAAASLVVPSLVFLAASVLGFAQL